jgi:N-acetylneuraminic acid mutarotase
VAASFSIGTKGYAGTGQGGAAFLSDFWEYDYLSDTWTVKAAFGGSTRRSAVGFAINGKGYIGLGQDAGGYKKDLWEYDTTANTWTQKADYGGTARRLAVAFAIDNKAWVGTGDDGAFTNDWWEYDQPSNSWFPRDDFPGTPRYGATGFAVNGKGYLACGYDTTLANRDDFWEYDYWTDTWTQMPDFPGGVRANAVAFTVDTLAFVGLGYDTAFYYDLWLWGDTTEIQPPDTTVESVWGSPDNISALSIAPNPVYQTATISFDGIEQVDLSRIRVYELTGKDKTSNCGLYLQSGSTGSTLIGFDRRSLAQGTYFIRVEQDGQFATLKFMIFD